MPQCPISGDNDGTIVTEITLVIAVDVDTTSLRKSAQSLQSIYRVSEKSSPQIFCNIFAHGGPL